MTTKSLTQRITEVIALCLVAIVAVPLGIMAVGRLWPKSAPQPAVSQNVGTPQSRPSPVPVRERVDSVQKLPSSYPAIGDVVLATTLPPLPTTLPEVTTDELNAVRIRHLNAYTIGEVRPLTPDARLAVVAELTPADTYRLAVWDLDAGKLVRFLASEEKPTQVYQGQENADFGAKVDFPQFRDFAVSPSGNRFAARQVTGVPDEEVIAYTWDVASGQLISRYSELAEPYYLFLFPDEHHLVMNLACGDRSEMVILAQGSGQPYVAHELDVALVQIDVDRSEAELLTPIGAGGDVLSKGSTSRPGLLAYLSGFELHTVDVASRLHRAGLPAEERGRSFYARVWSSPDGALVYSCTTDGQLDTWDAATFERKRTTRLQRMGDVMPAPDARLLAVNDHQNRCLNFVNVETDKIVSILRLPFDNARLMAISSNAHRLVISTDQTSLLVVDFAKGLPAGTIDLSKLLGRSKLAATR